MRGKPVTAQEIDTIRTLRLQDLTIYDIAERLDRAPSYIYNRIINLGFESYPNRLLAMKKAQETAKERYGFSRHTIEGLEHIKKVARQLMLTQNPMYQGYSNNSKKAWETRREKYGHVGKSQQGEMNRLKGIGRAKKNGNYSKGARERCRKYPSPLLELWRQDDFKKKMVRAIVRAVCKHPNKAETKLDTLLQLVFPNEYKYVGDGSFIIAGKCPDFVNVNGKKKIIELFGVAFHNPNHAFFEVPYERTQQGRIELFREYGFDTLIVWDFELDNIPLLSDRLAEFHNGVQV